ncbi:GNAT family N-acetyltransferase [Nocardioides humi]|uniref:GNAT family N-acetyltransferase n=1 Tax=Nocardioides humi TaxID=449461 RepID=A0ABN2BE66_9ACTN|nr:GNAT family N-acetyltransferase [Nocardioides humi]
MSTGGAAASRARQTRDLVLAAGVLDDPVGASLGGPHAHLARRAGRVRLYDDEVATFAAMPADAGPEDWAGLATLVGPGGLADLFSSPVAPPEGWAPVFTLEGLQLVGDDLRVPGAGGAEVVELGPADVPAMLDLVARTRPGPFWRRTPEMGTYLGVRDGGVLVAMAGERLHPPGWAEVSAVCTAPEARGRGLAGALVAEVAARIRARGEQPFLHVAADNTAAIRLYDALGFRVRRSVAFRGFRVPPAAWREARARQLAAPVAVETRSATTMDR